MSYTPSKIENSGTVLGPITLENFTGSIQATQSGNVTNIDLGASGVTAGTYSSVTVNSKGLVTSGSSAFYGGMPVVFQAGSLDFPNNSNWPQTTGAFAESDPTNASLTVRAFDDTLVTGVGFLYTIPTGAVNMIINIKGRANTAPGNGSSNTGVVFNLYSRQFPNNAAITSWSSAYTMTTVTVPTVNAYFVYSTQTISLSTLGLTAGNLAQFELCRNGAATGDNLVGSFLLAEIQLTWS